MLKGGEIIADGYQNEVINNENLNKLYGIDVEVINKNGVWTIKRLFNNNQKNSNTNKKKN